MKPLGQVVYVSSVECEWIPVNDCVSVCLSVCCVFVGALCLRVEYGWSPRETSSVNEP